MPVAGAGPGPGGNRQTSRPPWVKDGPQPIPMPSQPWVKSNRPAGPLNDSKEAAGVVTKALRKVSDAGKVSESSNSVAPERKKSSITIVPVKAKENGSVPASKAPEPPKATPATRKISEPVPKTAAEPLRKVSEPVSKPPPSESLKQVKEREKVVPVERTASRPRVLERSQTSDKYEGLAMPPKPPSAPPAPPAPPMPPPPPPLPPTSEMLPGKADISEQQKQRLEALRSRPKRRPDWGNMMKEIETSRKLCHVQCNDRSSPLLPRVKAKGQFVYESERPNLHNQLLKQIASGINLKAVKTNDRSKPFIEGLRKFRRQMTIEEQIQKSTSIASMGIAEVEPDPLDEVDDIDKVRDDLQSTKQLLAMELKNKEAMERENKKLLARLLNMEVELEKEKHRTQKDAPEDKKELEKEMKKLRTDTDQAKKIADEMETKYHDTAAQLDLVKLDLEETNQKAQRLEKQLKVAQAANLANTSSPISKQPSSKKINQSRVMDPAVRQKSAEEEDESSEEEETETETETESEGDEKDAADAAEKRQLRELKLLASKLKSFKEKRGVAKKDRKSLKEQTAKHQKSLRDERKKYKLLQKEVDKMSKLMNEDDGDEDEEEEEEESESEASEDSESESESESEESEGDLPESSPPEKKKANLQSRVKRYENLVSSLKKGNYLLKTNVERHRDELNKQKEMSLSLQEDLNSVLAELG